jgi:hypothetical protein
MFQIWACKQVLGIANTNNTVHKWDKEVDPRCPSCWQAVETMEHVLMCTEAGCVDIFLQTVGLLVAWLIKMDTALALRAYIVDFCQGWGYRTISEIADMQSEVYHLMAKSQDEIGWRWFMEGMVSCRIIDIQQEFFCLFVALAGGWRNGRLV